MRKILHGAMKQADDVQRMKYLLAKDDVDDIQAALAMIYNHLLETVPGADISLFSDKIELCSGSEKHHTEINITIIEDRLMLHYNEHGVLSLFNRKMDSDTEVIKKVISVITALSFYKTDETKSKAGHYHWITETYSIDVIRRRL